MFRRGSSSSGFLVREPAKEETPPGGGNLIVNELENTEMVKVGLFLERRFSLESILQHILSDSFLWKRNGSSVVIQT